MSTEPLREQLAEYPMGPNLARFIGVEPSRESFMQPDWDLFEALFQQFIQTVDLPSGDELSSMLEELVLMDLPTSAIALAKQVGMSEIHEDFRCNLAIGAAAMLVQDLILGEACFRYAQKIQPEEIAPYKNICEIFYRQHRDDACLEWAMAGLEIDPNAHGLWELIAAVYVTRFSSGAGEQLLELAGKKNSWAGRSLAAQYIAGNDPMFRAEQLSDLYQNGLREPEFLVEYTAALGVALEYDKIPSVVWQAEKMTTQSLPWQLYAHAAQAYTALEERDSALAALGKALKAKDLPERIPQELVALQEELLADIKPPTSSH